MARKPQNTAAAKTDEVAVAVAEAPKTDEEEVAVAVAEAPKAEAVTSVKVRAMFNRMRNPYTGAVFSKAKVTDVIDLDSPDNAWTRDQIKAKVLEVVG